MKFFYGIEHEVAFTNGEGKIADFSNTTFAEFDKIISSLPEYPGDYPQLRIGDAGIKRKRWYIEGFERFLDSEKPFDCVPKGVEIRVAMEIMEAVKRSLANDPDVELLAPLEFLLVTRKTPAHSLIERYKATSSIEASLSETYPDKWGRARLTA